jgi:hypothetical protein
MNIHLKLQIASQKTASPEGSQAQNSSQNFLFTHIIPKEEQWIHFALLDTQTVLEGKEQKYKYQHIETDK